MTKVIQHPEAYERATRFYIMQNAAKTWQKNTERADEIIEALHSGRRTDEYGNLMGYTDGFMGSMASAFDTYGKLTPKQSQAVLKGIDARAARKAEWDMQRAAKNALKTHIGTVGEKIVITLTTQHVVDVETAYGVLGIFICEDQNGNTIIYKGNAKDFPEKGESAMIMATVKEHGERDGVKQTIIQRPKVIVDTTI